MKFGRKRAKEDMGGWERKKWLIQFDQNTLHACREREFLKRNF